MLESSGVVSGVGSEGNKRALEDDTVRDEAAQIDEVIYSSVKIVPETNEHTELDTSSVSAGDV